MTDEQFQHLMSRIDELQREVQAARDDVRGRFATAEATFVNEFGALGTRVKLLNDRVVRLEAQ